tara:strand:+ start:199 stop:480 length:282 start_codon:yes stop_codon:yes gene_type:complete
MSDELIKQQITDIIEGEIQNGINDYLEGNEQDKDSKGFGGSVPQDEGKELKVNVSKNEVDRLIKEYKKIKKSQKSNLGQVKKMGLLDKNGRRL